MLFRSYSVVMVLDEVVINSLVQIEFPVKRQGMGNRLEFLDLQISSDKPDHRLVERLDHCIGVSVNGDIQYIAAMNIGKRRNIRPPPCQAKTQRGSSANNSHE